MVEEKALKTHSARKQWENSVQNGQTQLLQNSGIYPACAAIWEAFIQETRPTLARDYKFRYIVTGLILMLSCPVLQPRGKSGRASSESLIVQEL